MMQQITEDLLKTAKYYAGDQWSSLVTYHQNNFTYYIIRGIIGGSDVDIAVQTESTYKDHDLYLKLIKVHAKIKPYIDSDDEDYEDIKEQSFADMSYENLKKKIKYSIKYYILEDNFSIWKGSQQQQLTKEKIDEEFTKNPSYEEKFNLNIRLRYPKGNPTEQQIYDLKYSIVDLNTVPPEKNLYFVDSSVNYDKFTDEEVKDIKRIEYVIAMYSQYRGKSLDEIKKIALNKI